MLSETFRIRPEWPDFYVYEEDGEEDGKDGGRQLRFDAVSMREPPLLSVPDPELWTAKTPEWAHGRREPIVARLRASGCLLLETGGMHSSVLSPDGRLCVKYERIEDERSGLWQSVGLYTVPGEEVLVAAFNYGASEVVHFPAPGVVVLSLTERSGTWREIRVNAATRSFCLLPDETQEKLDLLPVRLGMVTQDYRPPLRIEGAAQRVLDAVCFAGSLALGIAGAWIAFAAKPGSKDFWMGLLCAAMFGASAWLAFGEWRASRAARRALKAREKTKEQAAAKALSEAEARSRRSV